MSSINKDVIISIEKSPQGLYFPGVEILLKLLDNIIREPANTKYRTIRLENKIIKEKLLSLDGIQNVLSNIGFELNATEFVLPANILIAKIKNIRDFIAERRKILQENVQGTSNKVSTEKNPIRRHAIEIIPSKSYHLRTAHPKVLFTKNSFLDSLEYQSDHVTQYEDDNLLKAGKLIIPIRKLEETAIAKLRTIQKAIKNTTYKEPEPCVKDLILVELVNWFNTEYFEWINSVKCKVCGKENIDKSVSNEDGVRVEIGHCCGKESKFFRYNNIEKLLTTRRGRCGEYANCFTFFCRCLGYDARYTQATFDHVWTEVYSVAQKRWLHIDPSDNVVDAPLMYQHGWKRKVDYIFAFSKDDIQDVTWRYTSNHKATLNLRNKCSEDTLLSALTTVREKRQSTVSDSRKEFLNKRNLRELVEMMNQRDPTENEKKGRSSGALAWRQERGEEMQNNFFIFELNDMEKESCQFNLRYSCTHNKYERFLIDNSDIKIVTTYNGWESTQFGGKNLFRKVEKDWKMTYLARNEGAESGEIIWKFDFKKSNLKIKNYKLKFDFEKYKNGIVNVTTSNIDGTESIEGGSGLIIKVNLGGGEGDIAWQHAQLFRQSLDSNDYPFELNIAFI